MQRSEPEGEASCSERYALRFLPGIRDSVHFYGIPQPTALEVRPTENDGRCVNTGSGQYFLVNNSEQ